MIILLNRVEEERGKPIIQMQLRPIHNSKTEGVSVVKSIYDKTRLSILFTLEIV